MSLSPPDRLSAALGGSYRLERGCYPPEYIAAYCPFLAPLRGTPEFDRIAARAAERKAEFAA